MNRFLQKILLPLSWLYGAGAALHNRQFDLGIRKSVAFAFPVIVVGNLSAGGTGKTPMAEYLISLLATSYKTGVLSRGYRRKTKGYLEVEQQLSYRETGDEPMQLKRKFPQVMVAVCESRVIGLVSMVSDEPGLQVVILDDAFQHRAVKPGFSILLTEYAHLFTRDRLLPAGRLRESASGALRADVIVVTKCPVALSGNEREALKRELSPVLSKPVFFSTLQYGEPYDIFDNTRKRGVAAGDQVLLFCGIANPDALVTCLQRKEAAVQLIRFKDHHPFSLKQLKDIHQQFSGMKGGNKMLLTTEKDAVRLLPFKEFIDSHQLEIYCMPVQTVFPEADRKQFDEMIRSFVHSFNAEDHGQSAEGSRQDE